MESQGWTGLVKQFQIQHDAYVQQIVSPGLVQLRVTGTNREAKADELARVLGLPPPRMRDGYYQTLVRGGLQVWTRPEVDDR